MVTGKSGTLTKAVTVTMYDEFPTMAFFDVQYTNTGTNKLNIKELEQQCIHAECAEHEASGRKKRTGVLVLPERFLRKAPELDRAAACQLPAGEFSRHECQRLRRRHADHRCLAPGCWRRSGTRRTASETGLAARVHAGFAHAKIAVTSHHAVSLATWRKFSYSAHFRRGSPGRLLPHVDRLPAFHDEAGFPDGGGARRCLRRHLVRVGLWPVGSAKTGLRHVANCEAIGIQVGHPRRWMAE